MKASLFGSSIRGEAKAESDIDILVELEEGKSLLDFIGLEIELEEVLQRKVDLLAYDSIHPRLKNDLLNEQKVFYEVESARQNNIRHGHTSMLT